MAVLTSPSRATSTSRRPVRWRLGGSTRKAVLLVHIVAAGVWMGIDVVLGVLVVTAAATSDPGVQGVAYQALGMFAVMPMLASTVVCLGSGVVLGLGSKYGLVRYWWVAVKLVLNVVLAGLVAGVLRPGMADVVEQGRRLSDGLAPTADLGFLSFPPVVSLVALTVAMFLSVFKPFGRIRRAGASR